MAKKLHIKNYGCQMNAYDGARMSDLLAPLGYQNVSTPETADLIILNTCHIREKASEKIYSELGRLRSLKLSRGTKGDSMLIGVAGCVAQAEGAEILRRVPFVDFIFGPQTYHRLPEMVARAVRMTENGKGLVQNHVDTEFPSEPKFDFLPIVSECGPSAFITIQEGCDKFCSFCVVPYTRGAEYSRPVSDILAEARRLASLGARELTLLGQNVNAYHGASTHKSQWGLAELIHEVAEIQPIKRIRYTTSHPRDMTEELIKAHSDVPKLMPYIHLPVQSGSDRVLQAMNRQHSTRDYIAIIDRLRAKRPDIAISSDFIVGHPSETEEDFEATLSLIKAVGYAQAYSFKYSSRPGTPSSALHDIVPEKIKSERLVQLQALLREQQRSFNNKFDGQLVPVLFDRQGRQNSQLAGRSPWMQAVHVDFPDPSAATSAFGSIGLIRVDAVRPNSLSGVFLSNISEAEVLTVGSEQ
ncbi:MAG: tRNA (N6-isopentenyl adenosine(37)-C2)-methylthiotransferase MiaB [Pseudomonadota bacterium]|nr:tRNA (N6-isopentenyl adenosine(37)-C2)-methylthiotransferase MiaB [Pseudomonadota bacterium]